MVAFSNLVVYTNISFLCMDVAMFVRQELRNCELFFLLSFVAIFVLLSVSSSFVAKHGCYYRYS